MIDKAHLSDKNILFRIKHSDHVYAGTVKFIENDGFWIESPSMYGQLQNDRVWMESANTIETPVLFVPTSSLMFLIASKE